MKYAILAFITGVYLLVGGLFAVRTPAWQSPDEPAHYNYIAQIAETGALPVIEMGDWNPDYLDQLKSERFAAALLNDLPLIQYEDHQPPLYYALAAPLYSLTDGSLTALRLFSVAIGVVIVWSGFGVGMVMFPQRPWIGLATAAFVAFLPQHVHILASVNNDALAWAIVGAGLVAVVAYIKGDPVQSWQMGLLVGVGFLTKATTLFMLGVVLLAIFLRWSTHYIQDVRSTAEFSFPEETRSDAASPPVNRLLWEVILFLLPALVLGGFWWARNVSVYGFPDWLGLAEHDAVVVGQPRTSDLIDRIGFDGYVREMARTTFNSFWGQFGWMAVPLPQWTYAFILTGLGVAFSGLGVDMVRNRVRITLEQRNAWIVLSVVAVLSIAAFAYYNSEFQQHQGRYMFPLLIPLGLWLAAGLDAWRRLILPRMSYSMLVAYAPLALLDVWLLWYVIEPNLAV
jgi:hypothetical protein